MLTLDRTHTLASLRNIKVVRPDNAGGQWQGVKHYDLVQGLLSALGVREHAKLSPDVVKIVLSRNDADMIGTIAVGRNGTCLGFAASNAIRKSLHLYVGGVWNGVPLVMSEHGGHVRFQSWTYDVNFRLRDVCEEMVVIWKKEADEFEAFAKSFFDRKLSNPRVSSIVADAAEKKLISWREAGPIWHDWKRKVAPEAKNAGTLMGLFAEYGQCGRPMDNLHNTLAIGQMAMQKVLVPA